MRRRAVNIAAAVLLLGLVGHGQCDHCDERPRQSCHQAGGHGGRHDQAPRPRSPGCSCPAHHVCGVLQAPQILVPASLRSTTRATEVAAVLTRSAVIDVQAGIRVRPVGRASPPAHHAPLFIAHRSLLI
ncbi:MAG: hypothetical protein E6J55_17295 [Deltaproteobacteria bacterium]|nr:MAG: hypothetical protein E6J55_17295 [Deltaproteobacteria bacterium]